VSDRDDADRPFGEIREVPDDDLVDEGRLAGASGAGDTDHRSVDVFCGPSRRGGEAAVGFEFDGGDDARAKAILRHTDLVTLNPKEATPDDVLALRTAGLDDADIVRLSELIAFVSYQIRVVAGLRLMAEVA